MGAVIAVDAMGGDRAPGETVAGALRAAAERDVGILLVGREDAIVPLLPGGVPPPGVEVLPASEVIEMEEDPAVSVRRKKKSSIVLAARAVREGRAAGMVGAGNTGATMAAAVLRMGRVRGAARPAIATAMPVPGSHPQILVDAGSTVDCNAEWLAQFGWMGREYARLRLGIDEPKVGLLSNGEEPGKGDQLRKDAYPLLRSLPGFIGNVEGRDLMSDRVDVVVTDGFTGNVALKTLEGALGLAVEIVGRVLGATPEARKAAEVVAPIFAEAAAELDPDATGGALLLGVAGVCVIAHGSSSAAAIMNAVGLAAECAERGIIDRLTEAVAHAG
jgi:glycerol-3-phosphate acyltransferase PlsX